MTQEQTDRLGRLRAAVAGLPSGSQLITAVNQIPNIPSATLGIFASVVEEAKKLGQGSVEGAVMPRRTLDGASSIIKQLMFLSPRGKQELAFFADHFLIKTAKNDIAVPFSAVKHIIVLDSIPKDTKGRLWIYLHIAKEAGVMNGKSPFTAAVVQVTSEQELEIDNPKVPGAKLSGLAAVVLCQAFGTMGLPVETFCSPSPECFSSSTNAAGVEAYVKARQGFLFPLPAGLCFLESPAMFIPRQSIRSVELARASGASSTFDLYVHCSDGTTIEFSNLARSEIGAIEGWVRATAVNVGPTTSSDDESDKEQNGGGGEDANAHGNKSDSESDADDEDFDPEVEAAAEAGGSGKQRERKKRKLSSSEKEKKDDGGGGGGGKEEAGVAAGDEEEEEEEEYASDSDSDDSGSSDSDSDGDSVELVSEDEFSMGQLKTMMDNEKEAK